MNLRAFIVTAIASLAAVNADVKMINHDTVQPVAQPEPTTDSEKTAVKYKPQLHISYGCHPYPAVQADGSVSAGLKWSGWANGKCKGSGLGSQVYSRSDWYKGKWAIMYAWYFPKGRRMGDGYNSGHHHYWSYAIVWIDNPNPDNSTILGVSMSAGVGYRKASPPKSKYVVDGVTVKFDSYRSFWGSKQGVRLTTKSGDQQDLITWEQLTDEARTALSDADFDVNWSLKNVVMPLKDDALRERLEKAYPF
ncbi:necrosis inducing-like protein NPP1 type [Phytophthora sojae]|uniref:Necrosis inducing-like protein NPP1 type n=1 Tax=Phytophthora sojae (strain P6497) TaxID=1094619 RepID=G5A8Q2_PHYSP|nr:necrosis inducing-like protein NPP1 type [Phytophthora sojae]EGZ08278.1 necrosis inducing-like protein NPP1 type [Phytophthora sojae]|eukprot:XP_009536450.1 necrosis inducing-like protein NPP1 type [Phytophthora sojae]